MTSPTHKSFSAFTNMEQAQWALALTAVSSSVGGVLLSGKTGTGKSALVQSLKHILSNKKLIKLPLSITEEMLNGTLDIEQTVQKGTKQYHRGILSELHNNLLFIDNINLLSSKVLNKILQMQEAGYRQNADGTKIPCQFSIIATMNPDEGGITSKLLDRFGLFIAISSQNKISQRIEILKEQELWDTQQLNQAKIYQNEDNKWKQRIQQAETLLPQVKITDKDLQTIAKICKDAYVAGHRGDIALLWASVNYAALHGRTNIKIEDILKVKDWTLAHRIRSPKQAPPKSEQNDNKQTAQSPEANQNNKQEDEQQPQSKEVKQKETDNLPEQLPNNNTNANEDNPNEEQFEIGNLQLNTDILQNQSKLFEKREGAGKRIKCIETEGKGRHIRSTKITQKEINDIDLVATLRHAAPYQKIRKPNGLAIRINKSDLHRKIREHRIGNTILFVVDASGSMGIQRRMREAKAGVFSLLKDAYVHRDSVGLMTFRKESSELLLPPTRSISRAYKLLEKIKTGGRTPLYHALQSAFELLSNLKTKNKNNVPIMILFTDGKATSSYKGENTKQSLQQIAQKYSDFKLKTFVIDTECGFIKLGYAKEIANWMQAEYYKLDDLKQFKEMIMKN